MNNESAKEFYNKEMPKKLGSDYEYSRWFKDPIQKAGYDLTKAAIERHLISDDSLNPARIAELGPGAGTWTKLLVRRFPDAYIDLVDISNEMLTRAKAALEKNEHIRYVESDVLDWVPEGKYDLFFSSRVIEYISDKTAFAQKVSGVLQNGGRGFIITKMPHYERDRFLGRTKAEFHRGQVPPLALVSDLRKAGFIDIDVFPVTVSVPLLHSASVNLALGKFLAPYPLGLFGMMVAESYCVLFRKPL